MSSKGGGDGTSSVVDGGTKEGNSGSLITTYGQVPPAATRPKIEEPSETYRDLIPLSPGRVESPLLQGLGKDAKEGYERGATNKPPYKDPKELSSREEITQNPYGAYPSPSQQYPPMSLSPYGQHTTVPQSYPPQPTYSPAPSCAGTTSATTFLPQPMPHIFHTSPQTPSSSEIGRWNTSKTVNTYTQPNFSPPVHYGLQNQHPTDLRYPPK